MSFQQAGREIQRFIINKKYNIPEQEMIHAVLNARSMNSTIRETDFEYGPGKKRMLKISYYPIQCDVLDESPATNLCDTGAVQEPIQEWFTINKLTKSKAQRLNVSDIRLVDGQYTVSEHAMAQISSMIGSLERELSKQITTDIVAHKGLHLDGTEWGVRVTMSQTTNGLITPVGYWQVKKEQDDGGFSNSFIIGFTEVWNWKQAYAMATDNTTLGQDFRKAGIPNLYYDVNLNSIMNVDAGDPEYILTFDPEALKFVSFSRNAGIFATDWKSPSDFDRAFSSGGRYDIRGSFMSPRYGILWDFYAKFKDCGDDIDIDGAWDWWLQLTWDIVYPTVQACNIQGVNGIMMYKTCPVVIPDCPEGTQPSPNAVARHFNWVPGSIYTPALLVSQITIGGVTTYPNVTVNNITELAALLNSVYPMATFAVSGAAIYYNGYAAITGSINSGAVTITFA